MVPLLNNFEIERMNEDSLVLKDKSNGELVNITITLFNNMAVVEEVRIRDQWIEGRYWSRS